MSNTFMGILLIVIGFTLFLIGIRKRGAQLITELTPGAIPVKGTKAQQPAKAQPPKGGAK